MYNEELGAYLLTQEKYDQLTRFTDGWEEWDPVEGYYVVNIWDDEILKALSLGAYSGGGIDINVSQQGGPM